LDTGRILDAQIDVDGFSRLKLRGCSNKGYGIEADTIERPWPNVWQVEGNTDPI
jgi:hypothetical protein